MLSQPAESIQVNTFHFGHRVCCVLPGLSLSVKILLHFISSVFCLTEFKILTILNSPREGSNTKNISKIVLKCSLKALV